MYSYVHSGVQLTENSGRTLYYTSFNIWFLGAGEMPQCLRTLVALPHVLGLIPSIYTAAYNCL